jgi:hypothetical protein
VDDSRRPKLGFVVEAFGFVNLFGNFIPHLLVVARHTPFLKGALDLPGIKQVFLKLPPFLKLTNTDPLRSNRGRDAGRDTRRAVGSWSH